MKTLLLIDGHAVIYRAYHALPELTTSSGELANATYGFSRILLTVIRDFEPDYIAVVFDHPKPTFRHQDFEEYKAHREEMPDDLRPQVEKIKQIVSVLNVPKFEVAGYEADDLIGTLMKQLCENGKGVEGLVVTGDKDLLQLVNDRVHVFIPGRGKYSVDTEYDPHMVQQKMGVTPEQIIDLKALMGDSSDNVPGVKGIGKKTATKLIQTFGSLEKVYQRVAEIEKDIADGLKNTDQVIKGAVLRKLIAGKESAFLSQKLVTILQDAPITLDLDACKVSGYDKNQALQVFEELGFKSLMKFLPADDFELGLQEALF